MEKTGIHPITPNSYYLSGAGALVTLTSDLSQNFDRGKIQRVTVGSQQLEIMAWGDKNDLPQVREALIADNNIVPQLIAVKRNILVGNGFFAFKKVRKTQPDGSVKSDIEEVEMPADAALFFETSLEGINGEKGFEEFLSAAAGEQMKHALFFSEFIRSNDGKIASVRVLEAKHLRAAKKTAEGKVATWYWSGFWTKMDGGKSADKTVLAVPAYNFDEQKRQAKFLLALGDWLFNDGYYPIPAWQGASEWIELANSIPRFHKANLMNGYNLRWHIEMPADYFLDYQLYNSAVSDEEQKAIKGAAKQAEQNFMDDVNNFLSGVENAGRALFTKYELEKSLGKDLPGIKIKALDYDMKDQALLALFDKSNTANISAQGIHPTLANIETAGKLSSGTEIRNAFLMWLIVNTHLPRRRMLRVIELVKKVNGWPEDVHFGIRDFEMAALSDSKSGMKESEKPVA